MRRRDLRPPAHPFLWGVATSGHQTDGNDTSADTSFLERVTPTAFREPAGIACDSWRRWETDLDLASAMGLNVYRFSVEWARVEPEQGRIDEQALAHYAAMVDGCLARGLAPVVTYSHFTCPHWFARRGSWLAPEAADDFARFAALVTDRLGDRIAVAITLNEPNLQRQLVDVLPPAVWEAHAATLAAASRAAGVERYRAGNVQVPDELDAFEDAMARAHVAARAAIKARRPELPVGLSIAIADEVALPGGETGRDRARAVKYGRWLELARDDDVIGVQNYEQALHGPDGRVEPGPEVERSSGGQPIHPRSLAGVVRYCHEATGVPVLVSEHGVATEDDEQRCRFLSASLAHLDEVLADGVPVLGYCHWTLLDNFEWIFGYDTRFGLHEVDRATMARTPKRSASVYAAEVAARRSAVVAR